MVQLLCENNIQLWLAGHEHDDIVRMQRDCFYEFQAGSLVAASNTRCCILTGELDTNTGKGILTAHHWVSPYGWESYGFINPTGKEKGRYDFHLQLPTEIHAETDNIAASLRKYSPTEHFTQHGHFFIQLLFLFSKLCAIRQLLHEHLAICDDRLSVRNQAVHS